MVNIKDVAKLAGVSHGTVSNVIRNRGKVSPKNISKVLAAINELNYEVNAMARSLKSKKTHIIGVVVENILSEFHSIIAKSIEDTAKEFGYRIILFNGDDDPAEELKNLKVLKTYRVDGIILIPTGKNSDYIEQLINSGMKMVLLDRLVDNIECDAVLINNEVSAYNATTFLIRQGYKRIAIITGYKDRTTGKERLKGYLRALDEAGVPRDENLIKVGTSKQNVGIDLSRELLEIDEKPEVIFTANLINTLGTLITIREKGLKIPDDIGIIGFDNSRWLDVIDPPITCVQQPIYELGRTASELLIKKIEKDDLKEPSIITLDTELVIRKSTKIIV